MSIDFVIENGEPLKLSHLFSDDCVVVRWVWQCETHANLIILSDRFTILLVKAQYRYPILISFVWKCGTSTTYYIIFITLYLYTL